MREFVPNFMYTYAFVQCASPELRDGNFLTWCNEKGDSDTYLFSERIRNCVEIGEWFVSEKTTLTDFLAVFHQLLSALNLANKMFKFVHNDLHEQNVLIRELPEVVRIPYYNTEGVLAGYVASKYVPYIIDFGRSRIEIEGIPLDTDFNYLEENQCYDVSRLLHFLKESYKYRGMRVSTLDVLEKRKLLEFLESFFAEGKRATYAEYSRWLRATTVPYPVFEEANPSNLLEVSKQITVCDFYNRFSSSLIIRNSLEYMHSIESFRNMVEGARKQVVLEKIRSAFPVVKNFERETALFRKISIDPFVNIDTTAGDIAYLEKVQKKCVETRCFLKETADTEEQVEKKKETLDLFIRVKRGVFSGLMELKNSIIVCAMLITSLTFLSTDSRIPIDLAGQQKDLETMQDAEIRLAFYFDKFRK